MVFYRINFKLIAVMLPFLRNLFVDWKINQSGRFSLLIELAPLRSVCNLAGCCKDVYLSSLSILG